MIPRSRGAFLFETLPKKSTDFKDAISHSFQFCTPLPKAFRIAQDFRHDEGTMFWGTGVHGPYHELDLRSYTRCQVRGSANNVHTTNTLAVESQIFRKGLAHE